MTSRSEVNRLNAIRHLRNAKEIELYDADGLIGKWVKWFDVIFGKIRWMQVIGRFDE